LLALTAFLVNVIATQHFLAIKTEITFQTDFRYLLFVCHKFHFFLTSVLNSLMKEEEDSGGTVVKVLCYKSEGRWFDPSLCHWNFSLTWNPSDRTMTLGSTQPLTEMSNRSISWGYGWQTYHHSGPLSRNLWTLNLMCGWPCIVFQCGIRNQLDVT